jgi:phage N-6-adenine-methyltransferase
MNTDLMFSSATDQWATPIEFFNEWNAIFGFTLDVCADADNAKCARFFDREADGLKQDWSLDVCWMNPPYGRTIGRWVRKAYEESLRGAAVMCLLPSRTDTKWFHDYCMKGEVTFLRGRLKFGDAKNSAPFPSIFVYFPPKKAA